MYSMASAITMMFVYFTDDGARREQQGGKGGDGKGQGGHSYIRHSGMYDMPRLTTREISWS